MHSAYREPARPRAGLIGGGRLAFPAAFKLATEERLRLPSVSESEKLPSTFSYWLGQVLVYPRLDCVFRKGRDVLDSHSGWVVPAVYVPQEAIGIPGLALLITPHSIEEKGERTVVIPSEIRTQSDMMQTKSAYGIPDPQSFLPTVGGLSYYPSPGLKGFFRLEGPGVRPMVRNLYGQGNLAADYWPGAQFPVLAIFP